MASTPATENSNMDTRDTLRDWLTLMTVTIAIGSLVRADSGHLEA
jgi:hypothetical protein